jgi:hypothetical protein
MQGCRGPGGNNLDNFLCLELHKCEVLSFCVDGECTSLTKEK